MGALSLWPADGWGTKSLAAQQDIAALFSGLDVHQNRSLILFNFFFCLSGIYVKDALCRFGKEIQTIKCKLDNNINSAMHLFQIVV